MFPRDGAWTVDFENPTALELGLSEEEFELLGTAEGKFPTSGEARRAGKKVVRAMHHLTASCTVELLDYDPDEEGT